ncbi:hypothetical protein B0T16DRAFT_292826, partial [Cercophora newfieldiana]
PVLPGPEVWSNKRGGLCESLPYYKAYKGSVYTKDCVARGIMVDAESEERDVFSAQVVIASIGGGRVKENGAMVRAADCADDTTGINGIMAAHRNKSPVAIIAGQNHPLYPCEPPAAYAVLDFFQITHVWKEQEFTARNEFVKVWRIRFEKIDLNKVSWWHPNGLHIADALTAPRLTVRVCKSCDKESPEIFRQGWTCLKHDCDDYYSTLADLLAHDPKCLVYSDAFINHRNSNPAALDSLPSLTPTIPDLLALGSHGTDLASRCGFVCPTCGCANRRVFWNRLVCENQACDYVRVAQMLPYSLSKIDEENVNLDRILAKRRSTNGVNTDVFEAEIDMFASVLNRNCITMANNFEVGGYRPIGSFTLFISTPEINAMPNGPTYMFNELERVDIGLKRNTVAGGTLQYEGLSRHFQQNFGAKYKFGVSVQSKGFNEAHPVVLMALQRLIWASNRAVEATTMALTGQAHHEHMPPTMGNDFNELLALGYRESDSIRFHDDGEKELGPTVAALSLGSPSIMKFRPKKKETGFNNAVGRDARGLFKTILEVPMKHGDMMVMHGSRIHGIYEHSVEPIGERRFSMTSRFVDPAKMALDEDRVAALANGAIPAAAAAYNYNG